MSVRLFVINTARTASVNFTRSHDIRTKLPSYYYYIRSMLFHFITYVSE